MTPSRRPIPGNGVFTLKQPIGVAGIITPWNFPAGMITRKVGAALVPAALSLLSPRLRLLTPHLHWLYLPRRPVIPKGVFNVVTAHENTKIFGKELCENKIIKKVSFTGSTPVGKIIMNQSSSTPKKLSFEFGGNASYIVFEDGDVNAAVEAAFPPNIRGQRPDLCLP